MRASSSSLLASKPCYSLSVATFHLQVFSQSRSLLFKSIKVRRLYDAEAPALVYVSYSVRLNKEDDENKSRFKTAVCVLPVE